MIKTIKKWLGLDKEIVTQAPNVPMERKELEQQVEKGVEKAVKEYRGAFEKLAEYDRT